MLRTLFTVLGNLLALVAAAGLLARFVPPDVWWPPAIIALALPGLLVLNALFIGLCLYRKWRKALILPVLVLLAALPLTPRLFAFGMGTGSASTGKEMTLVTANVRSFKNEAYREVDPKALFGFLDGSQPDVLLLQEARHDRYAQPYFKHIKSVTGLSKRHQPKRKTIATYGNGITFVADEFKGYNGFLVTDVATGVGTVRVINAHLQSNRISGLADQIGQDSDVKEEVRRAESMLRSYGAAAAVRATHADAIREFVDQSPYPVIVAGDFNDVPSSYTYQHLLTPRLRDAWVAGGFGLGTTFTGPLPGLRIDFVLVDTSLSILQVERVETGYSDHRALSVRLGQ